MNTHTIKTAQVSKFLCQIANFCQSSLTSEPKIVFFFSENLEMGNMITKISTMMYGEMFHGRYVTIESNGFVVCQIYNASFL